MAFDGHQNTFANSLFPTYQRQASVNVGSGDNGSVVLPFSSPSVSLQEQDTASYMPWSYNAHDDDPYGLVSCAQSSTKSRKPTDNTDCDGESDLQGLVSNILEEADSQDSYFNEGSLPTCNPVWSPKTLREELLQYFKSEAKTQHNPSFPLNYVSYESLSRGQEQSVDKDVKDFYQHSNGLAASQQWYYNLPNGERESCTVRPQKLPPGLPVPNMANTYMSQMQQSKYDSTSADKNRGNSQSLNNIPDLNDVFRPQSEMNGPSFHLYYEDQYIQGSTKPISNEQYVPQDVNQLVSSFQSLMAGEHDSLYHGDFPNMHRQTESMHHEDNMDEEWKIISPAVSAQSTPAVQTPKQLMGEFGTVPIERNGLGRNFQDLPALSSQCTEYVQQPKPFSGSFKLTMHRENTVVPSMNQYSKYYIQQSQMQSKIKQQVQKEKTGVHMSGYLGECFPSRPLTNCNMRGGDKKQALSQNLDHLGNMQPQRFDGENSLVSTGNTQQLMPLMYPVNDHRRHSSMPRPALPYRSCVPGMDMGDMMSASESAAFNSFGSGMMTHRGESTYHGIASAMTTSLVMHEGGPMIQLYFYLNECFEQWRFLEKERKRTEVILTKTFLGKRTAALTNTNIFKTPPNPTRVDHLIVNQMREQARVANLLDRMESLSNVPLHINIHTTLNRHHMAISITQRRRKEEIANMSKHQQQRAYVSEDRDTLLLAVALKDLAATTRKLRTALWCALQLTLPKPVKRLDHHVNREATGTERCPSPFDGYSFKI
uniref:meiosis-specific coiled-coil domain-containing protein MEIOC n=1 Tax=Scatophagus argus TaxID=75038 RepID=UPI001ED86218|nr:meiosis-specific coiled-coil domain-containing protein MEIOC [Scatophagus argus]XP_046272186.1 meiosis-specific coiled-coil domain-containing protein MEIOC [Scatophagus argus]